MRCERRSCSLVRPLGALLCVCGVLGYLAPVHRFARSVLCFACAVSWATWLLFTCAPAGCVALLVRCPGPLGSCSPLRPPGALLCVCGVLGHLAPVHRCARWVRCFVCAVSWAPWLLFTSVPAWFVVLCLRCAGPLGSCSPVHPLGALLCGCGVLGHLAPVHRCARSVCCVACAVSSATWLLFTGVRCVACAVSWATWFMFTVCACSVRCFACAGSWATWLLLTGAPTRCVALLVRCPAPLGSCSPVCPLGGLLCVCGVLGHLAPVHQCAHSVRCFACAVSPAAWLLFTGVPAWFLVLCLRCAGPFGSCSPVRPLDALLCWCGVVGHLAPVHRCALCCVCRVLGHLAPVHRCALCCVCVVLGDFALVHRCARSVCCFACAVPWATWLLFTVCPHRPLLC